MNRAAAIDGVSSRSVIAEKQKKTSTRKTFNVELGCSLSALCFLVKPRESSRFTLLTDHMTIVTRVAPQACVLSDVDTTFLDQLYSLQPSYFPGHPALL